MEHTPWDKPNLHSVIRKKRPKRSVCSERFLVLSICFFYSLTIVWIIDESAWVNPSVHKEPLRKTRTHALCNQIQESKATDNLLQTSGFPKTVLWHQQLTDINTLWTTSEMIDRWRRWFNCALKTTRGEAMRLIDYKVGARENSSLREDATRGERFACFTRFTTPGKNKRSLVVHEDE